MYRYVLLLEKSSIAFFFFFIARISLFHYAM